MYFKNPEILFNLLDGKKFHCMLKKMLICFSYFNSFRKTKMLSLVEIVSYASSLSLR